MKNINGILSNISLRIKLPFLIISIILVVFILSSYIVIKRESQVARDTIISSAKSYSKLSATEIITNYELYYDSGFFKFSEIVTNIMAINEDIEQIQIFSVNGKLLFHSDEILNGKFNGINNRSRNISDEKLLDMLQEIHPSYRVSINDKSTFEIIQPCIDEWGPHEYSIRYVFSFSRLYSVQQEMISIVAFYTIIFFVISFIFIYLILNKYITKPIKILIKGVRKIQKGILGEKIEVFSNDELGELSSAFNDMTENLKKSKKQLEKNIEQKNQLLIQLSHDLKNPLGPISNTISLLREMETDDSKKELLNMLQRNTDYIKNMAIRTIEYMKVNSADYPLHFKQIRLLEIIEKIIEIKKPLIEKKNITVIIDVDTDLMIKADVLYLEELLNNIIENAIIYNKENGEIHITAERNKEFITISIKDTGYGIDKDQLDKVFHEFYKVDPSRHDFDSSGLGLTIAKRIVELHGGKIWIESEGKERGIIMYFTLPSADDDQYDL